MNEIFLHSRTETYPPTPARDDSSYPGIALWCVGGDQSPGIEVFATFYAKVRSGNNPPRHWLVTQLGCLPRAGHGFLVFSGMSMVDNGGGVNLMYASVQSPLHEMVGATGHPVEQAATVVVGVGKQLPGEPDNYMADERVFQMNIGDVLYFDFDQYSAQKQIGGSER